MEVIAGVASASQLVAYSISCARHLAQLHTELTTSHSTYRSEETNINLLLDVIRRLPTQNIRESDPVLRILVDISGLACEILHLLQPKGFWIRWTIITLQNKLASNFEALDKKGKLLHLYITQASSTVLETIRTAVNEQLTSTTSSTEFTMAPTYTRGKISITGNYVFRDQEVFSGQRRISNDVDVADNLIRGSQIVGNRRTTHSAGDPTDHNAKEDDDDRSSVAGSSSWAENRVSNGQPDSSRTSGVSHRTIVSTPRRAIEASSGLESDASFHTAFERERRERVLRRSEEKRGGQHACEERERYRVIVETSVGRDKNGKLVQKRTLEQSRKP